MRLLWKERVILKYLKDYKFDLPRSQWNRLATPSRGEFLTHLIFKKKALMPLSYYIAYIFPLFFTERDSQEYHDFLAYLVWKAKTDGYMNEDSGLSLSVKGFEILHFSVFFEKLLQEQTMTFNFLTALFLGVGGTYVSIQGYKILIKWITGLFGWPIPW